MKFPPAAVLAVLLSALPAAAEGGEHYDLKVRASAIDKQAKANPEVGFLLEKGGKPQDEEHASVDTRVPSRHRLVIWLMGYNRELFDHLDGYGMNSIQVHYPREWFGKLYSGKPPADDLFLSKIRLEAATGKDSSQAIDVPEPDSVKGRSYRLVKWLARENPEGNWKQFLTRDGRDLNWDMVILSGASHGSTTAARMAKEVKVARVVMFSGPRDQFEVWQKLPSATPDNRYFGFSNVLDDGWIGEHYPRSWQLMGLNQFGPIVNVDETPPPYGNSRRLISTADVKGNHDRAHGSSVPGGAAVKDASGKFIHEAVWSYLFTHPVEETGKPVAPDRELWIDQRKPKPEKR